mgnify:CR=1 FL=1
MLLSSAEAVGRAPEGVGGSAGTPSAIAAKGEREAETVVLRLTLTEAALGVFAELDPEGSMSGEARRGLVESEREEAGTACGSQQKASKTTRLEMGRSRRTGGSDR